MPEADTGVLPTTEGEAPTHCGEPMFWHPDPRKKRGGYWRCHVEKKAYQRGWKRARYATDPEYARRHRESRARLRHGHIVSGLCTDCGQPSLSDWYCWDCLNKREVRRA